MGTMFRKVAGGFEFLRLEPSSRAVRLTSYSSTAALTTRRTCWQYQPTWRIKSCISPATPTLRARMMAWPTMSQGERRPHLGLLRSSGSVRLYTAHSFLVPKSVRTRLIDVLPSVLVVNLTWSLADARRAIPRFYGKPSALSVALERLLLIQPFNRAPTAVASMPRRYGFRLKPFTNTRTITKTRHSQRGAGKNVNPDKSWQ